MRAIVTVLGCALSLSVGCNQRDIGPITPHVSRAFTLEIGGDGVSDVDLLFVIDNSGSMNEEQESLRREIPRLIEALTNPPVGDDGEPEWNAVESLRVAIVTSDLGTGGVAVPRIGVACNANAGFGDAGRLRVDGVCSPDTVHAWESGDDAAAFAARVGCVADAGTSGCGLEQPLSAAVAALDQESGFPRAEALLAVVVLSDEEDCSLSDPVTFFGGGENGVALNQKCVLEPNLLVPIEGILAGLQAGRDPELFLFAALVGLPEDLQESTLAEMLADSRMAYNLTTENALGVQPACEAFDTTGMSRGQAAPGRRYIELATRMPGSLVRSICAESFQPAITELATRIGARVTSVCATRSLVPDAEGAVTCEVRETLPEGLRCGELVARTLLEIDEQGRDVCVVSQAVRGNPAGWRYASPSDEMCDQISYTDDAVPPFGVRVTLQCLVDVEVPAPGSPTR